MKSILFFLFAILTLNVAAQHYPASCQPTGNIEAIYRSDAYKLAIKRLHQTGSSYADSVMVPEIFIDSIEKALYAVHNIQDLLVADTVRSFYGTGSFNNAADSSHIMVDGNNFSGNQIQIAVNSSGNWTAINDLVNRYQLQISADPVQNVPAGTSYLVTSLEAINTSALLKLFEVITGVMPAYSNQITMMPHSNKEIIVEYIAGKTNLSYRYGCGDCPSGCTIWRTWKFSVNTATDCSVEYLYTANTEPSFFWLPSPCLDYMQTIEVCGSSASAGFESFQNSGPGLQWQVSTDGVNYSNISNDAFYSGVNSPALQLTNVPSSWNGNTYMLLNNGISTKTFFKIKFISSCIISGTVNWEDASTWNCGILPDSNTDVEIKSGTVNLNTDVTVRSLKIHPGASLNVAAGKQLTVLQ